MTINGDSVHMTPAAVTVINQFNGTPSTEEARGLKRCD